MRFASIRAPKQDDVRVFDLAIRTGPASRSENRRQTGDARGVSSPVTTVDIVRAHDGANELLGDVVQLVDGLGAAEHTEIAVIFLSDRLAERGRDAVHRLIPGSRAMSAIVTDERLGQTSVSGRRHGRLQTAISRQILSL